jgi:hypothetical protein
MKRKLLSFLFAAFLSVSLFTACDMVVVKEPDQNSTDSRELSKEERDELEKNGHFLKLINMPLNTQAPNVYSVSVANSSSVIGTLDKSGSVSIYRENGSCSVYLPLVYNNGGEFLETGSFYTAFTVHVDAVTKYVVDISERFIVSYTDGRGNADVNSIPSVAGLFKDGQPCLTIYNLPSSVSVYNFSNVFVRNQTGNVAYCADYSQIALSLHDNKAVAKIPLHYSSIEQIFTETGVFYVLFDINIDVETRYTLTLDDQAKVTFIKGNGYIDLLNVPDNPTPYLTLKGLPLNASKHHVSNVNVFNYAGPVAGCNDLKNIVVVKDRNSSVFLIPLSYSDGGYFMDSGNFAVSFDINVDIDTQIIFTRADNLILGFTGGSAEFDLKQYVKIPQDGAPRELTEKERDEFENNGHFLKLINMPLNTQVPNVFSVSVANSSSSVGRLNKNNIIMIYRENDSCTVYLPLVYNDDNDFLETGSFYTAFTIHVDALTKYIVDISDCFTVSYSNGRGQADVNNLPVAAVVIIEEPRYLTVYNLPSSVSIYNFSNVFIRNQTGNVAKCDDYSKIVLSVNDNKTTAKIPLHYNNSSNQIFTETGVFYVLFDINVDVVTRYTLTVDDQVKVSFTTGDGFIDILNIPENIIPYLTLKGLPVNANKQNLSDVNVYNLAGSVAGCSDVKNVVVVKNNDSQAFLVPLSSSDGGYFLDSGRFAISFKVNVDIDIQIVYLRSDNVILSFINGSAEFDANSFFGFFDASLTNINDSTRPIIKAGSSFDVNGIRHTVNSNYTVNSLTPNSSGLIFLYAFNADSDVYYEFSAAAPTYNSKRRGWYIGTKRALWKMIYLYNDDTPQFLFKSYIDDIPQFKTINLSDYSDYSQIIASKTVSKSINGANNSTAQTITLDPGIYAVELKGAGGGSGRTYNGASSGGAGGIIREIITFDKTTSFTAFTGSSGGNAPLAPVSGTFIVRGTVTTYNYTWSDNTSQSGHYIYNLKLNSSTFNVNVSISNISAGTTGGGGGGGGSGTFLYFPAENYLLSAGGGGGGSGGSYLTPGGGGGSGGSVGPGSGGGGSGTMQQLGSDSTGNYKASGGDGGLGGGFAGGSAGLPNSDGGNAVSFLPFNVSNVWHYGGAGTSSYSSNLVTASNGDALTYIPEGNYTHDEYNKGVRVNGVRSPEYSFSPSFSFSGNSGSGGNAAAISYPESGFNTENVGGPGASPLPLNPSTFVGSNTYSYTLTIGSPQAGQRGSNGGNNRNSSRGGGSPSGSPGSITIHKIY